MTDDNQQMAQLRLAAFVTQVAREKRAWGLKNAVGLATWKFDDSDESMVPFWSDTERATSCAKANFPGYQVFSVSRDDFLKHYLPALDKQGIRVGVNLSEEMAGLDVTAGQLVQALTEGPA